MIRTLVTGMSGTGKSTALAGLARLGYRTVDTDYDGLTEMVGGEWLWRGDRIAELLSRDDAPALFVSGTAENQAAFYPQFDHIVLLSAPADVLVERMRTRTTNPYGKDPAEVTETLGYLETVEPLLRRSATIEIVTTVPPDRVVARILEHVGL